VARGGEGGREFIRTEADEREKRKEKIVRVGEGKVLYGWRGKREATTPPTTGEPHHGGCNCRVCTLALALSVFFSLAVFSDTRVVSRVHVHVHVHAELRVSSILVFIRAIRIHQGQD
jgi:hypothetical protein